MSMSNHWFLRLSLVATLLTVVVVGLGAYVRLNNAGLGCPDWPGCYGHIVVPDTASAIAAADKTHPGSPVQPGKGWKEMIHRYFAGTLGLLVLVLAVAALRRRHRPGQQVGVPVLLLGVVIFQALLGMWTVTLKLKPIVVMGHLLGGMTTLALLWWLSLRQGRLFLSRAGPGVSKAVRVAALLGLVIVVCQIALGGWTSSNYAALACTDFPMCHGSWWPTMDFRDAFLIWHPIGINYEYGILDHPARVAIQVVHRIGALVTFIYVMSMALTLGFGRFPASVRKVAAVMGLLVAAQVCLGISNVVFGLPLAVAVAHNLGAAMLLLSLVTLNHVTRPVAEPLHTG